MAPALDSSPPPLVVDAPTELLSAAATPNVVQPAAELVVDAAPTAAEVLQAAASEPTLAELGLAHHTPVGLIQNMLEFMHVDLGLPWWGAIVVGQCNLKLMHGTLFVVLVSFLFKILSSLIMSCVATGTVLARLAVFPVIVKGQREAAKLNNILPEMTKLTTRMNEAKQSGNKFECKNLGSFTPLWYCG